MIKYVHNEIIDPKRRDLIDFKAGDRIAWEYQHAVRSGVYSTIVKFGVFHGKVRHTKRHTGDQMALITLDGQRNSRKPIDDLYHVIPRHAHINSLRVAVHDDGTVESA